MCMAAEELFFFPPRTPPPDGPFLDRQPKVPMGALLLPWHRLLAMLSLAESLQRQKATEHQEAVALFLPPVTKL